VSEPGTDRRGVGHDAGAAVVRPLTRAAHRRCSRPGCPAPARASLAFSYPSREVWIDPLGEASPQSYDLCVGHAARTQPPRGWQLRDRRPVEDQVTAEGSAAPVALDSEQTVAVLAAALRAVPDLPADGEVSEEADVARAPIEPAPASDDDPSPVVGHGAVLPASETPPPEPAPPHPHRGEPVDEDASSEPLPFEPADADHVGQPLLFEDDPDQVTAAPPATPKPILAARPRLTPPPARGDRAADW
jgi:hypothetical protein